MNNREIMQSILSGDKNVRTPQWLMSISSMELVKRLIPTEIRFEGYGEYPEEGDYPFTATDTMLLRKCLQFNKYIDRCAFAVGWGASAAFGHGGPGEFNKRVIKTEGNSFTVEFEGGAVRRICIKPNCTQVLNMPIKKESDLDKLELPSVSGAARWEGFKHDTEWAKRNGQWTIGWVNGFFSGVHYFLRDYQEFLIDLAINPRLAKRLIACVGNWNIGAAVKMLEAGVDAIGFCDDLGCQNSMLISPDMYRGFILPWHKRLCEVVHEHGGIVHMHSHGAIMPIVRDLREAGVDILNPLDPDDNMPMSEIRDAAGEKMVLCGGMNKHFWDWDRERQYKHLHEVVANGKRYGPHILMDSGGVIETVTKKSFDDFLAMSQEVRNKT